MVEILNKMLKCFGKVLMYETTLGGDNDDNYKIRMIDLSEINKPMAQWIPAEYFNYKKRPYLVMFEGEVYPRMCWPNAGKYNPMDGNGDPKGEALFVHEYPEYDI